MSGSEGRPPDGLGSIGPAAEAAVPGPYRRIPEGRRYRPESIAVVISRIGSAAEAAVPDSIAALKHYNDSFRPGERGLRARLDRPGSQGGHPGAGTATLKDEEPQVRVLRASGAARVGTPGAQVTWTLLTTSKDRANPTDPSDPPVIRGSMGEAAREAIPLLIEEVGDDDPTVRTSAILALAAIGPPARKAVPVLIDAIARDPDLETRLTAVNALGAMESTASEAIPRLAALKDQNARMRGGRRRVLDANRPADRRVRPAPDRRPPQRQGAHGPAGLGDGPGGHGALGPSKDHASDRGCARSESHGPPGRSNRWPALA